MAKILFSIGSDKNDKLKRWPWYNWIQLERKLLDAGHSVSYVGLEDDEIQTEKFDSFTELSYFIKQFDLVVCNDNGIMHIADALDVTTLVIFGPTSKIKNAPVNGETMKNYIKCKHGYTDGCYNKGKIKCDYPPPCLDITPQGVYEKAKEMLAN